MPLLNMKSMKLLFSIAMLLPVSLAMAEGTTQNTAPEPEVSAPSAAPAPAPAPQSAAPGPLLLDTITVYRQKPEPHDYTYGMRLDIAKVVSLEYFPPDPNFCGVIPAQMTYEDSSGQLHAIRYLYPKTKGCGN